MSKAADDPSSPDPVKPAPPAVNRRSILDYASPTRASDRFWRFFSSRDKVVENLRTLAWVVPITLVIWIYAEREQVVAPTSPNVSGIAIRINPDPTRYVELVGVQNPTVNLKLTGPQQAFERVRQELTSIPSPLKIDVGQGLRIGNNEPVNILDRIQDMDLFRRNGVTVQETEPANLYVNIYKLGRRELPVQVPPGITNLSDVTFDPPKIAVSGPEPLLVQLESHGELKAYASLIGMSLLKSPGKHAITAVPVALSSPPDMLDKLRIEQPQVKAELTVLDADVPGVVKDIPILLDIPPQTSNDYLVVVNDGQNKLDSIKVTGPKDTIEDLQQNRIQASATMVIRYDPDVTNPQPKTLIYNLPPGVKVDKEDAERKFNLKVTLR